MDTALSQPNKKPKYPRPQFYVWLDARLLIQWNHFLGCDSSTFTLPFRSSIPSSISRLYFGANWDSLQSLPRSCDWQSILSSEVQTETGKLFSFLHKRLDSITSARTTWMPSQELRIILLSKQWETKIDSHSQEHVIPALDQPDWKEALASKANYARPSASGTHPTTHSKIHLHNHEEINSELLPGVILWKT